MSGLGQQRPREPAEGERQPHPRANVRIDDQAAARAIHPADPASDPLPHEPSDTDPAFEAAEAPLPDESADTDPAFEPEHDEPPTGPRRILIAFYSIFALAATARAIVQLSTTFHAAPLAYLLSLFSGIVYIAATVGLTSRRWFSRGLAWAACGTEMVGVLVIGAASLIDSRAFPHDTVWSRFGSGYGYFPVLLPLLGLSWLWQTRIYAGATSSADRSSELGHRDAADEHQPDPS